jgi:hypothetical protein
MYRHAALAASLQAWVIKRIRFRQSEGSTMLEVHLATDHGDIAIRDDDLPLSKVGLKQLGISRTDLEGVFAVAADLMRGVQPRDRVRPVAAQNSDGNWEVRLAVRN